MATGPQMPDEAISNADRFYTVLKSLYQFDNAEIHGVILGLLLPSQEDVCFIGAYYRARANIESILQFQNPKHFQAIATLARGLFELAVDIRLLEVVPNAAIKMKEFTDVEKLRVARQAEAFTIANPDTSVDIQPHLSFIKNNQDRVDNVQKCLWPGARHVYHRSGLRMKQRVQRLKAPFEQLYEIEYPQLSWYVHPGLTGVANLKAETFTYLCSHGFNFAANAYVEVLRAVIRKFKLDKASENIEKKIKAARLFPFADTPDQVDAVARSME
jgi:hypothetical protein